MLGRLGVRLMSRFKIAVAAAATCFIGFVAVAADPAPPVKPAPASGPVYREFVSGNPDAKVTMIEYASLTCPHCARFNEEVMPELRKNYIDNGKIRYVFRDYPLDNLAAAAAAIARCAPGNRGQAMIDMMYKNQNVWARSPKPIDPLRGYAQLAGMSAADVDACLANKAITGKINEVMNTASSVYKVEATPTFFIGEEKLSGEIAYKDLAKIIDKHIAAGK